MSVDAECPRTIDQLGHGGIGRIVTALEPEQAARKTSTLIERFGERFHDRCVATAVADDGEAVPSAGVDQAAPHFGVLLAKLDIGVLERVGMVVAVQLAADRPTVFVEGTADLLRLLQVGNDEAAGPTKTFGGRVLDRAIEIGRPDDPAQILGHQHGERVMAE